MNCRDNNFIFAFILFFFLFSCSTKSEKKTINFNIENKQKEKPKDSENLTKDTLNFKLEIYNQDSVDLNITAAKLDSNVYFIERFPNKNIKKQILDSENFTIKHLAIDYKDSSDTKNAFYNLLDCFDKNCRSIKVFDKVKFKKAFFMLVVTEKSIHIIESEKNLDAKKWINFVRFSEINSRLKTIVVQKKQQNAKWFNYNNHQLIEIL